MIKNKYVIHLGIWSNVFRMDWFKKKGIRILKFNQSCWLKKYIDLNNDQRKRSTSEFAKKNFKLLNNACFGKTIENIDKRKDVKIVTSWNSQGRHLGARALIAKPNFHSVAHFTPDMIAVQLNRVRTYYNKPIYSGFSILDISKWKMYDFFYNHMKVKYNENVRLNYMDTDSFILTIKTNDFYDDIKLDISKYYDTSDYSTNNIYGIPLENKKVLGMMKDESSGNIIKEFIGLRAKMYSIDIENKKQIKKAKGVKKTVVKNLTINNYRDCLYKKKIYVHKMLQFRSQLHVMYTQCINKISLSYNDDKRYIEPNGVSTLPWNHYSIKHL